MVNKERHNITIKQMIVKTQCPTHNTIARMQDNVILIKNTLVGRYATTTHGDANARPSDAKACQQTSYGIVEI